MNSPVVSAALTDTVNDVALKMKDQKVGSIIIMEGENPVGIVSDWDIVSNAVVKDVKPSTIRVSDIMQKLHSIEGEEGVTEAARMLRQHNIKRLGVVYKNRLVGIISASDVIAVTPELVDVIPRKQQLSEGRLAALLVLFLDIATNAGNGLIFCNLLTEHLLAKSVGARNSLVKSKPGLPSRCDARKCRSKITFFWFGYAVYRRQPG